MCELFGFSSSKEEELNDYLKTFYSHCEEHPHGWGLAILDSDKYQIRKEPVKARSSVMLGNILLNPIVCNFIIAILLLRKIILVGDGLLYIMELSSIAKNFVNTALSKRGRQILKESYCMLLI